MPHHLSQRVAATLGAMLASHVTNPREASPDELEHDTWTLLTLLSLTTKVALTVMVPGMLVGTRKRRYRIRTSSNGAK
jgi:hypothetical protein